MESDWKKFRAMVPRLRERFLAEQNAHILALLRDATKNETERFWNAEKKIREVARTLTACLDGCSRSTMLFFMHRMINAGILRKEDFTDFSEHIQRQVFGLCEKMET